MERNAKELDSLLITSSVKRLVAVILANFLLLPVCGSALASAADASEILMHHSWSSMDDWSRISEDAIADTDTICEHPHGGDYPIMDCCDPDHMQSHIATPGTRPAEKVAKVSSLHLSSLLDSIGNDVSISAASHPQTAPPCVDKRGYAALVGIVKRLD